MSEPPPQVIERLYTVPPDQFTAARAAAVDEARSAGDAGTARQIGGLRKPTVAAWLVNLLAWRRPELVAELADLSTALRAAQRDLRGPQLRELSAQRRAVVAGLVAQARTLAAEAGLANGKLPLAEVETTLNAALSDVDVAEQVRTGRLIRAASYAGFGEVPRPQLTLLTGGLAEPTTAGGLAEPTTADGAAGPDRTGATASGEQPVGGQRAAGETAAAGRDERQRGHAEQRAERARQAELARQRRTLEREFAAARTAQDRAEADLRAATVAEQAGGAELAEIEAALAELERRRAAAEQELRRRRAARGTAQRQLAVARRRVGEVQAAVEALDEQGRSTGESRQGAHSGG